MEMEYDRVRLKNSAKRLLFTQTPKVWVVGLLFLLATDWVSQILDLFLYNPVSAAAAALTDWQSALTAQGDMTAAYNAALACFAARGAMVGLFVAVLVLLYQLVVSYGFYSYSLKTMRGQQAGPKELFGHFYLAGKIILLELLTALFTYLWCLLFIVPGIIAAYRYRLAPYLLLDDPDISVLEAIRRSKAMMTGYKGKLFVTDLSFLGWSILVSLGAAVAASPMQLLFGASSAAYLITALAASTAGSMFLVPYQQLTNAGFYDWRLKGSAPPVGDAGAPGEKAPDRDPWNL